MAVNSPGDQQSSIDASCRWPLAALFLGAAAWLVLGSLLALVASLHFHSPQLLAGHAWLTYGRLHAAAVDAQWYGFAIPAALGAALWIVARLAGQPLRNPLLAIFGAKLWHLGVLAGVIGILCGDSTGFERLEFPRYAVVLLLLAYLVVGVGIVTAMHDRQDRSTPLPAAGWMILAAVFWFPWIAVTANFLLQTQSLRGINQAVTAWWYTSNFTGVWASLFGLGIAFTLLPQALRRRLHSDYLVLFTFWTLIAFGGWTGIGPSAPVPAWMPVLSRVAVFLTVVPLIAVILNCINTVLSGPGPQESVSASDLVAGSFLKFGIRSWILSGVMAIAAAVPAVSRVTEFTWYNVAGSELTLYGFLGFTLMGAAYFIFPRVLGIDWVKPGLIRLQFGLALAGLVLAVVPLVIGGILQGSRVRQADIPFVDIARSMLPFLRASTMGDLLVLLASLLWLGNLAGLVAAWARKHCVPACRALTADAQTAEVRP